MDDFLQIMAGSLIFAIGTLMGYSKGFIKGGIRGYNLGAKDMENALFGELEKLRNDGVIKNQGTIAQR